MRRLCCYIPALLLVGVPIQGQDAPPADLAALELERTRGCVDVLTRLEALDVELAPLAAEAQRLVAIAGAINIEEASIMDSLEVADPIEAAVRDWFMADAELAQRYLTEQTQAILDERSAGREAILSRVEQALEAVQLRADSVVAPTGSLRSEATACSGAYLVRGAAAEACDGLTSRVCQAARDSTVSSPFPFVTSPDLLWDRQELRPWSSPTPLQMSPQGQLSGARTVGSTRVGNVVVSLSFNPLLQTREELDSAELALLDSINTPLGIESTHPQVAFVPALSIQATLPRALGGESEYLVHFGTPETPDVVWVAAADTGLPIAGTVALSPAHVAALAEGSPLTLTAVREVPDGEAEAVYAIELTSLNQVPPVQALLGYMGEGLSQDLLRLIPPENP